MAELCVYCNLNLANTSDHIIARKFFQNDQIYRQNLPKVPCCSKCNTDKQKIEDGPAVLVQFAHPSEGSKKVLRERIPGTLEKNTRLARSLKKGLTWDFLAEKSRVITKSTFIEIDKRNWNDFYKWYIYLVKGFYYFYTQKIITPNEIVNLFLPVAQKQVDIFSVMIRGTSGYIESTFGNNEFHLLFANNESDKLALFSFNFKSILVYGLVMDATKSYSFLKSLQNIKWKI